MNKLKKVLFSALFFSLLVNFSGCKKDSSEIDGALLLERTKINNLMFDATCYALTGFVSENNPIVESFYYPQNLKALFSLKRFSNSNVLYYVEDYFPNHIGMIECSGYFDGASDSGAWVDELLIKLEEERIAEELNAMDDTIDDTFYIDENQAEEIEKVFSGEIQANEITDKTEQLKFMEFENEVLIPQITSEGYIIIHSAGNQVIRNFYDKKFRLTTKETWNIASVSSAELNQSEEYFYDEDSFSVSEKKISMKDSEVNLLYSENGMIAEKSTYELVKDKPYIKSRLKYSYNNEGKVVKENSITYKYNQSYSKITESFEKEYIYEYNENEEIPADFEYFENKVLKMKNKYSVDKGYYTSQIFFDGGLSVKTYYEDYIRVKDVYSQNDKVIRVKEYED